MFQMKILIGLTICWILTLLLHLAFAKDCAPDLSSVGDSVITLSDELSDANNAKELCNNLGGYLTVTKEEDVNQTLMNAASQKYKPITYADIQRVWIYYNNDTNNLYKYSLSSNESSLWVSPQHLGHLWYLDLYTTPMNTSIPIRFCEHRSSTEKWLVAINRECHHDWPEQFVLYGLPSPKTGYKAIYAHDQGGQPYSIRLTDVKSDKYNNFTNLKGTFYAPDTQRVWIYYNNNTDNLYKYSLSSNEASPWVSPQHLGHLWYIDLYTSSTDTSIPIRFCEHRSATEKWLVSVNSACHPDWPEQFVLYGLPSPKTGYKAIYAHDQGGQPYSIRLTDVKSDKYNNFTNLKRTFYAPASDVFIGARFDHAEQQWQWSDGAIATEFSDVNHTVCLQKVLDYGVSQYSNRACTNSEAYYSCKVKVKFKVEKIECNSTTLNISWNLLPFATTSGKTLQVNITATHEIESISKLVSENVAFTILSGLSPSATYDITVTGSFICDDTGSFTSSFNHTMGPGQPSDVTHPYVIKSEDSCNVTFANPLSGESFDIVISTNNLTGKVFNSTFYCNIDTCHIPFNVTDYPQGEPLKFTVNASNCEGFTETRTVAGTCVGLDYNVEPACGPTLISSGNLVETLSNDFTTPFEAESKCSMLGGNFIQLNESDLSETFYERLTEKYLEDVQRIWIYRSNSSNNRYKYSFTNLTDDDWVVPDQNESISYFDLYNRLSEIVDEIHFCKSGKGSDEKWLVNTTSCIGEEWESGFQLFGRTTQTAGFKRVYMFQSKTTDSVKLKYTDTAEDAFIHIGDFWIPDINVYVGQVTGTSKTNSITRLHYGNGWEKVDNVSDGLPSYYACSVSPGINLQHVPCDSSTVQVKWSNNLLNLDSPVDDLTFEVSLLTDERYVNVSYQALNSNITNLESRNNYTTTLSFD